jgi:hypothetical protein
MKAVFTFHFWFQSLFMTVFMTVYISCKEDSVSWQSYLLFAASGLLYGWLSTWLFKKGRQAMEARLLGEDADLGEAVIAKDCITRFRGLIADGGVGYLLRDRLVFIPHKLNFSRKTVAIPFSDIESVSGYKVWRIFSIGVKIILKSGKIERFVVDHVGCFYSNLMLVEKRHTSPSPRPAGTER